MVAANHGKQNCFEVQESRDETHASFGDRDSGSRCFILAPGYGFNDSFSWFRFEWPMRIARDLAGLDKPIPPAPAWETWRYPQSTEGGGLEGTSVRYNGVLVRPPIRMAAYSSTDSFETIAQYYAKKLGFTDVSSIAGSYAATQSEGRLMANSQCSSMPETGQDSPPTIHLEAEFA